MAELRFSKTEATAALQMALDRDLPLDREIEEPDLLTGGRRLRNVLQVLTQRFEEAGVIWPTSGREASLFLLQALREGLMRASYVDRTSDGRKRIPIPPVIWPESDDGSWQYGPIYSLDIGDDRGTAPWHVVAEVHCAAAWLTSIESSVSGAPRKRDSAERVFLEFYPNGKPDSEPWKVALQKVNRRLGDEGKRTISERTLQKIAEDLRRK